MLRFSFCLLVLFAAACSGCQQEAPKKAAAQSKAANNPPPAQAANQPKPGDNKPILNVDAGQSAAMHFHRAKTVQKNKNDFAQLAMFYIQYETENNRPPASWQDLKAYMGREAPHLVKLVEAGDVEIIYNVKLASNAVILYEKTPDLNGNQFVAFGDHHVEALTPDKLKQALKNR